MVEDYKPHHPAYTPSPKSRSRPDLLWDSNTLYRHDLNPYTPGVSWIPGDTPPDDRMYLLLFQRAVQNYPGHDCSAWIGENGKMLEDNTFATMWKRVQAVSDRIRYKWNIQKGQRALLIFPPGIDFIVTFLACLVNGVIAVPTFPPNPANLKGTIPKMRLIWDDSQCSIALSSKKYMWIVRAALTVDSSAKSLWPQEIQMHNAAVGTKRLPASKRKRHLEDGTILDEEHNDPLDLWSDLRQLDVRPSDIAFLQYTSGSTGAPKGVMIRHENLWHNVRMCIWFSQAGPGYRLMSWLPQFHDMGLIATWLTQLGAGWRGVYMDPVTFIRKPLLWIEWSSREKINFWAAPTFAYGLVAKRFKPGLIRNLDLSSLHTLVVTAEPVVPSIVNAFIDTFGPYGVTKTDLIPGYGLAEHTVLVTCEVGRGLSTRADPSGTPRAACGAPVSDFRVVNPDTMEEVELGQTGEIWLASLSCGSGYWDKPELSEATFRAELKKSLRPVAPGTRFMRSGDLGMMDERYRLYCCGRIKDLIIIRGRNYYPNDVEGACESVLDSDLRPGCLVAFSVDVSEELQERFPSLKSVDIGTEVPVLVADVRPHITKPEHCVPLVPSAVQSVLTRVQLELALVVFLGKGGIPKTTSGKIQRRKTKELFVSNKLKRVIHIHECFHADEGAERATTAENTDPTKSTGLAVSAASSAMSAAMDLYPPCVRSEYVLSVLPFLTPDDAIPFLASQLRHFSLPEIGLASSSSSSLTSEATNICSVSAPVDSGEIEEKKEYSEMKVEEKKEEEEEKTEDLKQPVSDEEAVKQATFLVTHNKQIQRLVGEVSASTFLNDISVRSTVDMSASKEMLALIEYVSRLEVCSVLRVSQANLLEHPNLSSWGMDSMRAVRVQGALSDRLQLDLPSSVMALTNTVPDMATRLSEYVVSFYAEDRDSILSQMEVEEDSSATKDNISKPFSSKSPRDIAVTINSGDIEMEDLSIGVDSASSDDEEELDGGDGLVSSSGEEDEQKKNTHGDGYGVHKKHQPRDRHSHEKYTFKANDKVNKKGRPLSGIVCRLLEFIGFVLPSLLLVLCIYPAFRFFTWANGPISIHYLIPDDRQANLFPGLDDGNSYLRAFVAFPVTLVIFSLTLLLSVPVVKWSLVGRVKAGQYDLWGFFYYRWSWYVSYYESVLSVLAPVLSGSPLYNILLRCMGGTNISLSAKLDAASLPAVDLIHIGHGASISGGAEFACTRVDVPRYLFELLPISVGDGASVGDKTILRGGVFVHEGAAVSDTSFVEEGTHIPPFSRWSGQPAVRVEVDIPAAFTKDVWYRWLETVCVVITLLVTVGVSILPVVAVLDGWYTPPKDTLHLEDLGDKLRPLVALVLFYIVFQITMCVMCILYKWVLVGRVREGRSFSKQGWYSMRRHIVSRIHQLCVFNFIFYLWGTHFHTLWFWCMGADVDSSAVMGIIFFHEDFDLYSFGASSTIGSGISLTTSHDSPQDPKVSELSTVCVERDCTIGH